MIFGKNLKKPVRQSELLHSINCKIPGKEIIKKAPRISDVEIYTPNNLNEALRLNSTGKYKLLAAGTDVMIELRAETKHVKLLNIYGLKALSEIKENKNEIVIGSCVSFSKLLLNKVIRKYFPMLTKACSTIGSVQIRNRATIGGNIMNAAPCADSAPPLAAYDAAVVLKSIKGSRKIPVEDFISGGYKTQVKKGEILISIIIPKPKNKKCYMSYYQLGRRGAMNITRLSAGVLISFDKNNLISDCRIVEGSLLNRPVRIRSLENLLVGKKLDAKLINIIEEPLKIFLDKEIGSRWSSEYKVPVFINICKELFKDILNQKSS